MELVLTLGVVVVIAGCGFLAFWLNRRKGSDNYEDSVEELYWKRRAKIPLLVELYKEGQSQPLVLPSVLLELIELRKQPVSVSTEEKISRLTEQLPSGGKNTLFLALEKEVKELSPLIEARIRSQNKVITTTRVLTK